MFSNADLNFWLRMDTAATSNLCSSQLDFDTFDTLGRRINKQGNGNNDLIRFYKIPEKTLIFSIFSENNC